MDEMIKVELPATEWMKMERNHEIVENFKGNIEIFGHEESINIVAKELNELLKEETE